MLQSHLNNNQKVLVLSHNRQSGIALIQILIITAIISTIALYVTQSARQQVQMALWAKDKSQALVNLHTSKNDIMFKLLTVSWTAASAQEGIAAGYQFNLYNQGFRLVNGDDEQPVAANNNDVNNSPGEVDDNGTIIQIQDQAGLINLLHPQPQTISKRLMVAGLSEQAGDTRRAHLVRLV